MDSDSVGDRQKEIQISKSDDMENAKEPMEVNEECGREQEIPKFLSPEIRETERSVDSDSVGERQKDIQMCKDDNMENTEESIEENGECAMEEKIPKILSPELHDVFPVFASMLDIKSFMKLAMTSKDMYKRCTEDKTIKIDVEESYLIVRSVSDSPVFDVESFTVPEEHIDGYLDALQKLPCRVYFRFARFEECERLSFNILDATLRFTTELGVAEIDTVIFTNDFKEYAAVLPIMKSFKVIVAQVWSDFPSELARDMLELNIERLTDFSATFSIDRLLEENSTIPHIFTFVYRNVEKDKFMQLIAKIQSGALRRVTVNKAAVDWDEYDMLPYDHDGPLPDERPLLLARIGEDVGEYWFLDWQGNVTKCFLVHDTLDIYKCEPWEYPWILREKEDIMKALFERHMRVSCTAEHFEEFASAFEQYAAPRQGELPNERPLFFKMDEHLFWFLLEGDTLMACSWMNGVGTWKTILPSENFLYCHPALTKFMFWKLIENDIGDKKSFSCEGAAEYKSLFEDCTELDFDYSGDLPTTCPVVFARASTKDRSRRIVLIEGRAIQCTLDGHDVTIKPCALADLPPILVTTADVKNLLQETLKNDIYGTVFEEATVTISFEKYVDGFELFKASPPVKRPFVYERVAENDEGEKIDERWYSKDGIIIRKAVWRDGRLLLTPEEFARCPMEFMKMLFRKRVEETFRYNYYSVKSLFLDYEQFNECLEQFTIVPFDYSGPLTNDSPLAFMKKEIRHTCRKGRTRTPRCKCTDFFVFVWFLWNGRRTTYCSWTEENPREILFEGTFGCWDTPPALATKEHLRNILQGEIKKDFIYEWVGGVNDLRSLFARRLPLKFNGPLPEERPLVFEGYPGRQFRKQPICYLLREDGIVIKGKLSKPRGGKTFAMFSLPIRREFLPPALRSLSIKYAREFREHDI